MTEIINPCGRIARACALMAAAATAGSAFAAASALPIRLFGETSPSVAGLNHLYVLAWFQEGGAGPRNEALGAWSIGDAAAETTSPIDINSTIDRDVAQGIFDDPIVSARYTVIGLYEGGGVSLSLLDSAFIPTFTAWESLFATSESTVQGWLESGNTSELYNWFHNEMVLPGYAPQMGVLTWQVNFSNANVNGTSVVDFAEIPAPGFAIFAIFGVCVARRRR